MSKNPTRQATQRRTPRMAELRAQRPQVIDEGQVYAVEEAAAALSCSRAQLYRLIDQGKLATFTDGRRRKIPGGAIRDYVAGITAQVAGAA